MVPGGRVELPTPAFSGPRSTGELPRHRGKPIFYSKPTRSQSEMKRNTKNLSTTDPEGLDWSKQRNTGGLNRLWRSLDFSRTSRAKGYFIDASNSRIQSFFF